MAVNMLRQICVIVAVSSFIAFYCNGYKLADFDPSLFMELRSKEMREMCPEGVDRCNCGNSPKGSPTFVNDSHLYYDQDPLGATVTYLGCNPDYCFCKNTPEVERDSRQIEMAVVMDLCPRGEMNRCLCAGNKKVVDFPFDLSTFFFQCRPKRCKCNGDDKPKLITAMGCREGGFPYCTRPGYFCANGERITRAKVLKYSIEDQTGCICKDGSMPICEVSGKPLGCPNGDPIDWTLAGPGVRYIKDCKLRPDEEYVILTDRNNWFF